MNSATDLRSNSTENIVKPAYPEETETVRRLKEKIRILALENRSRKSDTAQARAALDEAVAELLDESPFGLTLFEQIQLMQGCWRQLWSDSLSEDPFPFRIDRARSWQCILENGVLYNAAVVEFGPLAVTALLKGSYGVYQDGLQIEFQKVFSKARGVSTVEELALLIRKLTSGEKTAVKRLPLFGLRRPQGKRAMLKNIYIDADLRIAVGKARESQPGSLFIMDREPVSLSESPS